MGDMIVRDAALDAGRGMTVEQKFWSRVDKSGDCWIWTGSKAHGYGRFYYGNSRKAAHRFSYELANGVVLDKEYVCHSCDNPACVNPAHLFLGSQFENMRDCAAKRRNAMQRNPERSHFKTTVYRQIGERHGSAKLKESDVSEMFRLFNGGKKRKEIAVQFGVSPQQVCKILSGKRWSHLGVQQ